MSIDLKDGSSPKDRLIEWCDFYTKTLSESGGDDLARIKLIEEDWDTRFLFLATHYYLLRLRESSEYKTIAKRFVLPLYASLVMNTYNMLIQFGVNKEEALSYVPNFHVRQYDYLIYCIGALNKYQDADLDGELMASWFSTTAEDLVNSSVYLESSPSDNDGYIKRGKARLGSKDYEGAIEDYSHVLDSDTQNFEAYFYRAIAHDRLDQDDSALADFSSAIKIEPNSVQALVLRAELRLTACDDRQGSISDLSKAIEVAPDNFDIYSQRAAAYVPAWFSPDKLAIEDCSLAINDFLKVLENKSENAPLFGLRRVYELRGDLYIRESLFAKAVSDFGDAIQICDSRELFTKRGNAKKANGDIKGACEDWKNVLNVERTKYDTDESIKEEIKEAIESLKQFGEA